MGRRQQKNNRVLSVQFLLKARKLTEEQAAQLEAMYRRCRSEADFEQVRKLVDDTCAENKKGRWAKIASGDPFGFDEPDDDEDAVYATAR